MNEEFETVKVKAGNIDKDGYTNLKIGADIGSEVKVLDIDAATYNRYFGDPTKYGTPIEVTDEGDIAKIKDIEIAVCANINTRVRLKFPSGQANWYYDMGVAAYGNLFAGLAGQVIDPSNNIIISILIINTDGAYYLTPQIYALTPYTG